MVHNLHYSTKKHMKSILIAAAITGLVGALVVIYISTTLDESKGSVGY